jgi:hypothetical protein
MLRHIISVSLAMTACASFIPTKANAASLTFLPVGSLQRNPGDSIEFILALNPAPHTNTEEVVKFLRFDFTYDGNELSLFKDPERLVAPNTIVNNTRSIARFTFNVLQPVKDGITDVSALVEFEDDFITTGIITSENLDVEPVPEPLTIFGTATALGCGVLFKRKSSKKTVS